MRFSTGSGLVCLVAVAALAGCRRPDAGRADAALAPEVAVPCASDCLPEFTGLFATARKSVVNVSAAHRLQLPLEMLGRRQRELLRALVRSLGSGFFYDTRGHVVTCSSVIEDAEQVEVILADGRVLPARVVASDAVTDLAVLEVEHPEGVQPLSLGGADELRAGQWVAAIGYPFGLSHSMSAGTVAAVLSGRQLGAAHGLVLTDLAINPGSNGGPLLDLQGRVVGINLVAGTIGGGPSLALPVDDARRVIELLVTGRTPPRPWLGLSVQYLDAELARSFGLEQVRGALVSRIHPAGPAERAGLRPGDVVLALAGRPVEDPDDLVRQVQRLAVGRRVQIGVWRRGRNLRLSIVPTVRP